MNVQDLKKCYNSNTELTNTLVNTLIAKAEQEEQCRATLYANFVPNDLLEITIDQADFWSTHRLMYEILGRLYLPPGTCQVTLFSEVEMKIIKSFLTEKYYHYDGKLDDSQFTKPSSMTDREWKELLGKLQ